MEKEAISRNVLRNIVVAFTLGIVGIATWAVTDPHAPTIEAAGSVSPDA